MLGKAMTSKVVCSTGFAVLTAIVGLVGCAPSGQEWRTGVISPIEFAKATDGLRVESFTNLPSFMVSPTNPTGSLNLFISPSCNDCEILMLNVLTAYRNNDPVFVNIRTTFSLIPASVRDVDLISGFMCIDSARRPKAIKDYYTTVNNKIGMSPISEQFSNDVYVGILNNYGISEEQRKACESSQSNRKIVGHVYEIGDRYRSQDVAPIVIYNDKNLNVIQFSDLKRAMR